MKYYQLDEIASGFFPEISTSRYIPALSNINIVYKLVQMKTYFFVKFFYSLKELDEVDVQTSGGCLEAGHICA